MRKSGQLVDRSDMSGGYETMGLDTPYPHETPSKLDPIPKRKKGTFAKGLEMGLSCREPMETVYEPVSYGRVPFFND